MTTEELVKNLFSDRNGRFVQDASGHFSFKDELEDGKTLAETFAARTFEDKVELLKKCYKLADETVISMNAPFKVKIKLSDGSSGTDAKDLLVSTSHFDDERISAGQAADIFIGLCVHEASHLLYTDFTSKSCTSLVKHFANIIEDERIERKLREHRPGLIPFLGAVKEYYFDEKYTPVVKERLDYMQLFTMSLLKMIRYPKDFDAKELEDFGEYLLKAKEILTPYPESTAESFAAAEKIYKLFESMSSDGGGGGSDDKKEKKKDEDKSDSSDDSSGDSSEKSKSEPEESKTGSGGSGGESHEDFEKEMEKVERLLNSMPGTSGGSMRPVETSSDVSFTDLELIDGRAEKGKTSNVFFRREKDNKEVYDIAYAQIKQYIPAVARQIRGYSTDRNLVFTGLRSGKLDTHKLSQAVQGAQNVYYQNFKQVTNGITVCILIDESGSMIREDRAASARRMAILLNEAVGKLDKVNLYIYGHSADESSGESTDMFIFKENNRGSKYALGSIDARDNNRDGIAILEAAMRVRRQTNDPVLMFVLSDGVPAAHGYIGIDAIAPTKACVEQVEKMGFDVVQICINGVYDPGCMFTKYIKLEDMSTFPHDLGKIIKHKVLKNMRVKVV